MVYRFGFTVYNSAKKAAMKGYLWMLFCVCFFCTTAQEVVDITAQKLENEIAGADDRELEDDDHDQQLEYHQRHRMNINTLDPEWLVQVLGLTVLQVHQFREYRKWLGPFIDMAELQAVPGWDTETIKRILPFLKLDEDQNIVPVIKERLQKGEHSFLLRTGRVLEKSIGFLRNDSGFTPFSGDRQKLMLRYMYRFRNLLQWGITAEKDPGETMFKKGYKKGFDFYSAHLAIRDFRFIKAFIAGDYHINLGQGLVHWQSMAFRKSAETIQVIRQGNCLRPYNGTDENRFHRGAGIEFKKNQWSLLLFLAKDKLDGNIAADPANPMERVLTSFQTSGLHRTRGELQDKDVFTQDVWGGQIGFRQGRFKIAINGVQYHFNENILKRNEPYNLYAIAGRNWANYSVDYGFSWKNLYLFGETAKDFRGDFAFEQGLLASIHPKIDFSCVYRNISPAYRAIQSNAFTENAEAQNENGIYAGISIRPKPGWRVDAYIDLYKFPWVSYNADMPSAGQNQLIQVFWKPHKKLETYLRFQKESKSLNVSGVTSNINELELVSKTGFRLQWSFQPFLNFTIRNRIDLAWYEKPGIKEEGFQAYIDFIYKALDKPYSFSARMAWFQTDGYNSRIYGYENDVLYYYTIPALFDTGMRFYFLYHHNINRKWQFWCKLSSSLYADNQSVGSGLTEILKRRRSEIRLQLLYRF
jgi:Helix-hairpin-helix motif